MNDDLPLHSAPIFTALTRPPMIAGVTLDYFGVAAMAAMCLFIGLGDPLYLVSFFPLHLVGWIGCRIDPNIFRVWFKCTQCPSVKNKAYWGCQSYDPS